MNFKTPNTELVFRDSLLLIQEARWEQRLEQGEEQDKIRLGK